MKVSIVTISLNQAEFLERAICSVLEQDYRDIEYVVVDGGSNDGSREIIERYRRFCAGVILLPDDGPGQGLNSGLNLATGEIFGYLNSDDILLPGAISTLMKAWTETPAVDVLYGHGYLVDERGRLRRRLRSAKFDLVRAAFGAAVVVQQATFFHRRAVVEVGGFNAGNRTCWDYELLVDLALAGKIFRRIDRYLALYRAHTQAMSAGHNFEARTQVDLARIFEKIMKRPKRPGDGVRRVTSRLEKWVLDPKSFLIRAGEMLVSPSVDVGRVPSTDR